MLVLYWRPPTEGASPQRLKIHKEGGGIALIDGAPVEGGAWKYEVDDCAANRRWIEMASRTSGWSKIPPGGIAQGPKPKREPKPGEIAEPLTPKRQIMQKHFKEKKEKRRARSSQRLVIDPEAVK